MQERDAKMWPATHIGKIKAPSGLSKVNRMMHRIFASRADSALVSLALSWTVTAKADISRSSGLRGNIAWFLPISFDDKTVKSRLP